MRHPQAQHRFDGIGEILLVHRARAFVLHGQQSGRRTPQPQLNAEVAGKSDTSSAHSFSSPSNDAMCSTFAPPRRVSGSTWLHR
jgi:hypothetical protein